MPDSSTAERPVRRAPFGAPHVFVLTVVDGDTTLAHRITRTETVIGRGPDVDFVIADEQVSKRHCTLRAEGSVCTLLDRGSLNGTSVNGRKLRAGVAQRVRHLDEIQIGDLRLLFLTGRFAPAPPE